MLKFWIFFVNFSSKRIRLFLKGANSYEDQTQSDLIVDEQDSRINLPEEFMT